MEVLEVKVRVEQFKIDDTFILERRSYTKELGLGHTQLIFYNRDKFNLKFADKYTNLPIYTNCKYGVVNVEIPDRYKYIDVSEFKSLVSNDDYIEILLDAFRNSSDFYESNIIFPYLLNDVDNMNKSNVKEICTLCIEKRFNIKSFVIQSSMKRFIQKYDSLIDAADKKILKENYTKEK